MYAKLVFDNPCTIQGLWNPFIPLRQLSSLTTLAKYINYTYFKNIPILMFEAANLHRLSSFFPCFWSHHWAILSMEFPRVILFSAIFFVMNSLGDCLKKTLSSLHFWSTFSAHKDFPAGQLFHHFRKVITLPSFSIVSVECELLVYCHFLKLLSILLYDYLEGSAFVSSA